MSQSPKSVLVDNICDMNDPSSEFSPGIGKEDSNDMSSIGIDHPRNLVLELSVLVGQLSNVFLKKVPLDPPFEALPPAAGSSSRSEEINSAVPTDGEKYSISRPHAIEDEEVKRSIGKVLLKLIDLSHSLSLKLGMVIVKKMQLNEKKYPADLCRGKAGKYTEYSSVTGITKDEGQSTQHNFEENGEEETIQTFLNSLGRLTQDIGHFANERQWTRYHKPRNLLLALLGELGELAEIFQWRGDTATIDGINKEDMDKIGQELADVTIYLIRLSDVSHIDLKAAAQSAMLEADP